MGRQELEERADARAHEVVLVAAATGAARRCDLAFTTRGACLTAGGAEILRVPWWALEGLSRGRPAEQAIRTPSATGHPTPASPALAVELLTDAGTLVLRLGEPAFRGILDDLGSWAPRWKLQRRRPVRWLMRTTALLRARLRSPAFVALRRMPAIGRRAIATRRAGVGVLGSEMWKAAGPLLCGVERIWERAGAYAARNVRRNAAFRPALVLTAAVGLSASAGVTFSAAVGSHDSPRPALAPGAAAPHATPEQLAMAGWWGIAETLRQARRSGHTLRLVKAKAPPPPSPPSVANQPPLRPHEVFGFAPYWTLSQESQINVWGFTTLSYFAVDATANGTISQSGAGWEGYQSQDFADLVARAHAAGDRVVLTVECFAQATLEALTTSPQADATLASTVLKDVSSKNLDGVNIDFEGNGNRAGMTTAVATVSRVLHAANPHYQVTVDTDASSAADSRAMYDVPALARVSDGLFVMSYGLNLGSAPTTASPITSSEFSDVTTASEYEGAIPPAKVILGVPYYGYVWPTNDGTMSAVPTGQPVPLSDGTALSGGHPLYWDGVTDTAWTSYEVGKQWYEAYFTDPASVYMVAQLAQNAGFAGVGAWALGMDGNDPQMTAALDGNAPAERAGPAGPASTTMSVSSSHPAAPSATPPPVVPVPIPTAPTTTTTTTRPPTTTTTTQPPTTTTTTQPPAPTHSSGSSTTPRGALSSGSGSGAASSTSS